jgi:hypothetical protein
MRSSSRALVVGALALAAWAAAAGDLGPASPALCRSEQKVVFHCSLGAKSVSLCAGMQGGRITSLDYRYGTRARVELVHEAGTGAGAAQPFKATQSQLTPSARVRQVWFDRASYTYVVSQCIGGGCPYSAGLAVLNGDKVVSSRRCQRTADDRASFAQELARFGPDAAGSEARTDRLVFDDIDLGIDRLYPTR